MTETTDCETLTDDGYAQYFITFKSHSDQDKAIPPVLYAIFLAFIKSDVGTHMFGYFRDNTVLGKCK